MILNLFLRALMANAKTQPKTNKYESNQKRIVY
ncbi:MAG: hypothetical protein PWR03_748 [Tenuifilum sp.]|jgi:hypothetical protein|nr:hypothetical protein [Tenuifilum sp.]